MTAPLKPGDISLTPSMADLLWTVAQHKYGWTHVSRYRGQLQVADGLVRRGLVEYGRHERDHYSPTIAATDKGRAEIVARFPVSPFALGTYEHQPGGWTPRPTAPVQGTILRDLARRKALAGVGP